MALGGYAAALTLGYVMGRFQRPAAGGQAEQKPDMKREPIAGDIKQATLRVPLAGGTRSVGC